MNMLDLTPFEFDQTGKGWRSLEKPAEQINVIKEYIDIHKNIDDDYRRLINFHLGQVLAMRNLDENDIIYAIHHMKLSYSKTDKEWNDYVNATIAFLKKDRKKFNMYVGKQNYNQSVIERLHKNFVKDYEDAY